MQEVKTCWICRSEPATTGEHKWPHSYLRKYHANDWSELQHGRWDGHRFNTKASNSKNLKHSVLCPRCNNERTAPQDRALSAFLTYLEDNHDTVLADRTISLTDALGSHEPLDFYRALLKLEFSRLSDDQLDISPEVADFVLGSQAWEAANSKTRIEFRIAEEMVPRGLGDPFETDAPFYEDPYFVSHQINFGWFGVHYLYAPQQRPDLPWPRWETESVSLATKGFDSRPGQLFPEL